ncbi:MAG: YbbR-like domain-containing protein [Planctomycetota bacterium]|jgi:hypothetical protein
MSDKLNKFLVVVFLTLLIWTWAFMSKAKERSFIGTLAVSPSTDPSLLVTFFLNDSSTPLTEIPLKSLNFVGAPSKLSDLQKRYSLPLDDPDVERLNFYYDPSERTEGTYTLEILDHLQNNIKIQELALALESCTPPQVTVNIERLVEKELPVQCVNKDNVPLNANSDPPVVNIYVRKGYPVESATVVLTPQLIEAARKQPVSLTPYVELGGVGMKQKAASPVQITLQTEEQLKPYTFKTAKPIGVIMSEQLQSKYKVTILNDSEIRDTTTIFASDEAYRAYQDVTYPIMIEIKESEVILPQTQIPPKKIIYNFPPEYVKSGEIRLDDTRLPKFANIKIEPINPSPTP